MLKGSSLVAFLVHAVPLDFSDAKECWLLQSGHSLMAFLPVECVAEQQYSKEALAEMEESLYGNLFFVVIEVWKWISVKLRTYRTEMLIKVLHKAVSEISTFYIRNLFLKTP